MAKRVKLYPSDRETLLAVRIEEGKQVEGGAVDVGRVWRSSGKADVIAKPAEGRWSRVATVFGYSTEEGT